jgi:hypothetical protein
MNQADHAKARSSAGLDTPLIMELCRDRMTFRTTLRETRKSRQIALIVILREKYARRILAIASTISISNSAP